MEVSENGFDILADREVGRGIVVGMASSFHIGNNSEPVVGVDRPADGDMMT